MLIPSVALAHAGHGKPGILHSHTVAEEWMANAALLFLAAVALAGCYRFARAWLKK